MASAPERVVVAFLCSSRSGEEMEDRLVSAVAPLLGSGLPKQSPERVEWCPETESNRHVLLGTRDFKCCEPSSLAIDSKAFPIA